MEALYILKNIAHEGPGLFGAILDECSIPYQIVDLDAGDALPAVENVVGLLVMGGPDSANDETDKMIRELEFVDACFHRSVPYLGICLGLQVGVKVLGGNIVQSPLPEVAWKDSHDDLFQIHLTESAAADVVCKDLPTSFPVFQLHGEAVELTERMQLLGTGTDCPVQMVRMADGVYGLQSHPELDRDTLDLWLSVIPELQSVDKAEIVRQYEAIEAAYLQAGRTLFINWLRMGGLIAA